MFERFKQRRNQERLAKGIGVEVMRNYKPGGGRLSVAYDSVVLTQMAADILSDPDIQIGMVLAAAQDKFGPPPDFIPKDIDLP